MSDINCWKTKHLQYIRGLPFTKAPRFSKKHIEQAFDYMPRDDDIIISSYPKTGTTWLQYIVLQILSKGESFPNFNDLTFEVSPYMEMAGTEVIEKLIEPRVYKQHLPYSTVKKNHKAKYLYIYRKPEDTLVSSYHFIQDVCQESIDFNRYFDDFLTGDVAYGCYFQHVLSYLSYKNDMNLFITTYERLHSNTTEEIFRIARFLGEQYFQDISNDEAFLKHVIEHTSFEYMKDNIYYVLPDRVTTANLSGENSKRVNFFRKGIIGDGKQSLSLDQMKRLRIRGEQLMNGTSRVIDGWF